MLFLLLSLCVCVFFFLTLHGIQFDVWHRTEFWLCCSIHTHAAYTNCCVAGCALLAVVAKNSWYLFVANASEWHSVIAELLWMFDVLQRERVVRSSAPPIGKTRARISQPPKTHQTRNFFVTKKNRSTSEYRVCVQCLFVVFTSSSGGGSRFSFLVVSTKRHIFVEFWSDPNFFLFGFFGIISYECGVCVCTCLASM